MNREGYREIDIYGRFQVEVLREHEPWTVYRLDPGKRRRLDDGYSLTVDPERIAAFLMM